MAAQLSEKSPIAPPRSPLLAVDEALRVGIDHTVVVVTGAEPLDSACVAALPANAIVLAADGGLDHALAAGLRPAGLIGDLDSVSPAGLAWAEANATITQHDPRKDQTDSELALAMAVDMNPARLVLVAGGGDRLDHTLAALGALGHPSLTSIPIIEAWWGRQRLRVVHGPGRAVLDAEVGATISLLAAHGVAEGVTVTGVEWPLEQRVLEPLVGLGISNVVTETPVVLTVLSGVVAAFFAPVGGAQ